MKKFIREYIKIIAYTAIGLAFFMTSFYLLINYYHQEELSRPIYISQNDANYLSYKSKLEEIDNNLKSFHNPGSISDSYYVMYNKLSSCSSILKSEGTLATLKLDTYYKPYDVYKLGSTFQSEVLNKCWAIHLSYLTSDKVPNEFLEVAPYITNSVDTISGQTSFALEEIQNNSSYFYTTNITSSTIRNYLSSDYTSIAKSYNQFADIILTLSKQINESNNGGM